MLPNFSTVYSDTEELSRAVDYANVRAMQISRGDLSTELRKFKLGDWYVQYINFVKGTATCSGDGPSDRYAFVIPLRVSHGSRLLGRPVHEGGIGIYAPGSEHADVTFPGYEQVVLVPPAEFARDRAGRWTAHGLPAEGSCHVDIDGTALAELRTLLRSVMSPVEENRGPDCGAEVVRSIGDALTTSLGKIFPVSTSYSPVGRPPISRAVVLRRLLEFLHAQDDQPIYATELSAILGASEPTVRRLFLELFGVAPARYLLLRRLYLARRRLQSGRYDSVSAVAASCGFWDASRFSKRYGQLFGDAPIKTLRLSK